ARCGLDAEGSLEHCLDGGGHFDPEARGGGAGRGIGEAQRGLDGVVGVGAAAAGEQVGAQQGQRVDVGPRAGGAVALRELLGGGPGQREGGQLAAGGQEAAGLLRSHLGHAEVEQLGGAAGGLGAGGGVHLGKEDV